LSHFSFLTTHFYFWRGARIGYSAGLENRWPSWPCGFEPHPLRKHHKMFDL
jgi:hypothetical protein